jgi:hypothetical protein
LANCARSYWCINGVNDTGKVGDIYCPVGINDTGDACIASVVDTGEAPK